MFENNGFAFDSVGSFFGESTFDDTTFSTPDTSFFGEMEFSSGFSESAFDDNGFSNDDMFCESVNKSYDPGRSTFDRQRDPFDDEGAKTSTRERLASVTADETREHEQGIHRNDRIHNSARGMINRMGEDALRSIGEKKAMRDKIGNANPKESIDNTKQATHVSAVNNGPKNMNTNNNLK